MRLFFSLGGVVLHINSVWWFMGAGVDLITSYVWRWLCVLGFFILVAVSNTAAGSLLETLIVTGTTPEAAAELAPGRTGVEADSYLPGVRIDSAELLRALPGVQADSRSNYAQDTRITLRGFGARSAFGVRGIDLQVDGVPLTTPDGQGQLSSVALETVARAEVLTGPTAALFGNGAGGVIALQSRAPDASSLRWGLAAGEGDMQRQSVQGQWRQGDFGARVYLSDFETDGDRPHAAAERRHAGLQLYHTSTAGLETIFRLDTSRDPQLQDPLGLTPTQWLENPRQINEAAETFDTRKAVSHQQASITVRQPLGNSRWQTSAWSGAREISQYLGFTGAASGSAGGVVDLQRDFYGINGNYSRDLDWQGTSVTATLGAELASMEDRRRGYVNDFGVSGDLRRDEVGGVDALDVYTLLQWRPGNRWLFFGGFRHSDMEVDVQDFFILDGNPDDSGTRDFVEWSTALGGHFYLSDQWTLFASTGRGFETPTLTEMAYQSSGSGLNMDLAAASNRQHEVGLRLGLANASHAKLTLFAVDSTDEILVDQSVGGRTTYRNAAGTERRGIELSGYIRLAPAWSTLMALNYLSADYSAGEWQGNRLPGLASHNHFVQLRWQPLFDERLTLALAVQHRSRVATHDDNQTFAPAATTADFAITTAHRFGHDTRWQLSAWLKVVNLTNKNYVGSVIVNQSNGRSFEPAPERNVNAGIEMGYRW